MSHPVRALALIDGEHYPPVVRDALRQGADRYEWLAAVFLGGAEKIERAGLRERAEELYGVPVVFAGGGGGAAGAARGGGAAESAAPGAAGADPVVLAACAALAEAIDRYRPAVVVDLSDEPVLGYAQRFRLASTTLAREVGYVGPDFHFSPSSSERLCTIPSLAIIGTGKRVGKTALSGYVSRVLHAAIPARQGHPGVVVVAMGRGGPGQPEVVDGTARDLTAEDLLAWSRQGKHAASDYFEGAALSGVVTVGCRRCGGGMAGQVFASNVADGVRLANGLEPGLVVLEGSGAAQPPVAADARLLIAGAHQPVDDVAGYLGAYRLLISDAVVLTMAEEPLAGAEKVGAMRAAIAAVRPDLPVLSVVFRPKPVQDIAGRRVAVFSTAPRTVQPGLQRYMEERFGCEVEVFSTNLADRDALREDLRSAAMDKVDIVVTEIKAAAIDVVAEKAVERGLPVVFMDNVPVEVSPEGSLREESRALEQLALELAAKAGERFEQRA